jgi:hypothetical protein
MNKRVLILAFILGLFLVMGTITVSAATGITINDPTPANAAKIKGTITVNTTVRTGLGVALSNFTSINYSIYNSAGTRLAVFSNTTTGSLDNVTLAATVDTTNGTFTDATGYTINITVSLVNGTLLADVSRASLNLDNTAPSKAAISIADTTPEYGDKITITCTGADAVDATLLNFTIAVKLPGQSTETEVSTRSSEDGLSHSFALTNDKTQSLGGYSVSCNVTDDHVNVNNTKGFNFTVNRKQVNRRFNPAKAAAEEAKKKVISEGAGATIGSITQKSLTRLMQRGSRVSFTVNGEAHKLTVKEFTANTLTIVIESEPKEYTVNTGETKEIDADGDGKADMKITYNGEDTIKKAADITIQGFTKEESAGPGAESDVEAEASRPAETTEEPESTGPGAKAFFWIVLVIVVVLIIYAMTKGKGKKKGK